MKKEQLKKKLSFRTKSVKNGGYSIALTVIVLTALILVNILVAKLPSSLTQPDMTKDGMYTLSDKTEQICSKVDQDVYLYFVAQTGAEDMTILDLLEKYKEQSKYLHLEKVDPIVSPTFVNQYAEGELADNSVIVVCGDRNRLVDYSQLYQYQYTEDYSSYDTVFYGESYITAAIDYVSTGVLPIMYTLSGHGSTVDTVLKEKIAQENIELKEWTYLTEPSVPEDAVALLIYSPRSDLSQEEAQCVWKYLQQGGHLMLITDYIGEEMPNLQSLTENYGVYATNGLIFEDDASHYMSNEYNYYMLPDLQTHEITEPLMDSYYVLVPFAHGISRTAFCRSTVNISDLLMTSESAYLKEDTYSLTDYSKTKTDQSESFSLAAAITEATDNGETQIVWIASSQMLYSDIDNYVGGGNLNFFLNCLDWMCEHEETISLRPKTISQDYLTITKAACKLWEIIMIFVLPIAAVAIGIVQWYRRKRR